MDSKEIKRRRKSLSPDGYSKKDKKSKVRRERSKSRDGNRSRSRGRKRSRSRDGNRSKSRDRSRSKSRDRSQSKSRDRSLSKSRDKKRSKSRDRSLSKSRDKKRSKSRDRSLSKSRDKKRSKSRDRSLSKSRDKKRSKSKDGNRSRSRDRKRSKSKDGNRCRSRDRKRSKSKDGNRSRSRDRKRSRSRDGNQSNKDRKRSRSRDRKRSRSKDRKRSRSKDRKRSRSRDRNRSRSRDGNQFRSRNRNRSRSRDRNRSRSRDFKRFRNNDNCYKYESYWSKEKEMEKNEDRHGEVSNSYYGTELKKSDKTNENGRSMKKNNDKYEEKEKIEEKPQNPEVIPPRQKKTVDLLTSKTGGAYIPPARLRLMQAEISDKSGPAYQRIAWEALKKSIHGFINKVNTSNIGPITRDLLKENIVRGRGLLARSIIQAQAASLTFTNVYAALVAVINSQFPNIGELLLTRLALQFRRGYKRNDKTICISSAIFIAHLVNQGVAHEILILEILTLLVHNPTDDSIEVAIAVLKECGMKLTQVCRKGIEAIFEMLRNILHEGNLDKRVQYMIEVMFQIRKDGFKDFESVPKELDLVEEEDQLTHLIELDQPLDDQNILNAFKFDAEYTANEDKYKELTKVILNSDDSDSDNEEGSGDEDEDEESDKDSESDKVEDNGVIVDNTETNLVALRRTIYLTIHSSLDFEECAHKLMKMQLKPGQEIELCNMFLDCCAEMRTYEKFFGLLAGRFCAINKIYVQPFETIFKDSYDTIHRLDTNRLRNVAKFFAHLLMTDSISWAVLSNIKLNEEDTTSSSRVFIKILFQELSEYMGLPKLNNKLKDEDLQESLSGLFPKDDAKNTRFAINFFTSIGLGGLTDDLREHLKNRPKPVTTEPILSIKKEKPSSTSSSSSSSSSSSASSSSSSSSSSSTESSSSSDSSEDERRRKKKKKKLVNKKKTVKRREVKEKKEKSKKEKTKRK